MKIIFLQTFKFGLSLNLGVFVVIKNYRMSFLVSTVVVFVSSCSWCLKAFSEESSTPAYRRDNEGMKILCHSLSTPRAKALSLCSFGATTAFGYWKTKPAKKKNLIKATKFHTKTRFQPGLVLNSREALARGWPTKPTYTLYQIRRTAGTTKGRKEGTGPYPIPETSSPEVWSLKFEVWRIM